MKERSCMTAATNILKFHFQEPGVVRVLLGLFPQRYDLKVVV